MSSPNPQPKTKKMPNDGRNKEATNSPPPSRPRASSKRQSSTGNDVDVDVEMTVQQDNNNLRVEEEVIKMLKWIQLSFSKYYRSAFLRCKSQEPNLPTMKDCSILKFWTFLDQDKQSNIFV